MANILVTGGSGLIGWLATERLVSQGHEVVIFSRHPNPENLSRIKGSFHVAEGDVADLSSLLATMRRFRIDHILHLAGFFSHDPANDPAGAFKVNIIGTANIFDAALALDVKRVCWSSTVAVNGVQSGYDNRPVDEEYRTCPIGAYGASKYATEIMADMYNNYQGLDIIGIRLGLTYGIGRFSGGAGFFNESIRKAALGQRAGILPSCTLHQPMYNRDAAELFAQTLLGPRPEHHIFNPPVEASYTNDQVVEVFRKVCPDVEIYLETTPPNVPMVPVMDGSRAHRELNFTPRYTLEEGVREMVDIFRVEARRG